MPRRSLDIGGSPLSSSDEQVISDIFHSGKVGYTAYAVNRLLRRTAGIKPDNLPDKSEPFWKTPDAALARLRSTLTPERVEVIRRDYGIPAIVIEPDTILSPDTFPVEHMRRERPATPPHTRPISGWSIGIADIAKELRILATDGDVEQTTLRTRAKSFHGKKGNGSLGFESLADRRDLYKLVVQDSRDNPTQRSGYYDSDGRWRSGYTSDNTLDVNDMDYEHYDVNTGSGDGGHAHRGPWTMGTKPVENQGSWIISRGGYDRVYKTVYVHAVGADHPNPEARIRLVWMVPKQ